MVTWFRLRYPWLSAGGLAASAPVDFYERQGKQQQFYDAVIYDLQK